MAHIPDQPIVWRIEHPMQCNRQLDDAEACPKVATGHRNGVDRFLAQFGRELRKLIFRQLAQIVRCLDAIE
jgi:hypothetical protein